MFQAIGGYNPYSGYMPQYPNMTCGQDSCSVNQNYSVGAAYGQKMMQYMQVQGLMQNIAQSLAGLQQMLQSPDINATEKNLIKNKIQELQRINEKLQSQVASDTVIPYEGIKEYEMLIAKVSNDVVQKINERKQKEAEAAQRQAERSSSDESTGSTGTDTETGTETGTEAGEEATKNAQKIIDKEKTQALEILEDIYAGSIGNTWGTDEERIRKGTAKINKDNVAAVICHWEEQYGASAGKSIVTTLFDEEHGWNPRLNGKDPNKKNPNSSANIMDMLWNMTVDLKEKAKELGIYNDLAGAFTVAFDELDDFCVDQDKVEENLKTIAAAVYAKQVEKLVESEQQKIDKEAEIKAKEAEAKEVAEAKKAEAEEKKKAEEENKEAKKLFLQDMREIWDDNSLEISSKVKFEDGLFQIRIEGKDLVGSDFNELAAAIEDAGFDPKDYLCKKRLNIKS